VCRHVIDVERHWKLVAEQGFEPRPKAPKTRVLPLHHSAIPNPVYLAQCIETIGVEASALPSGRQSNRNGRGTPCAVPSLAEIQPQRA
jgi:hypothetical protein